VTSFPLAKTYIPQYWLVTGTVWNVLFIWKIGDCFTIEFK